MHQSQDRDKWRVVVVDGLHERGGIYVLSAEEVVRLDRLNNRLL
jgi:hypothetical protein